MKHVGVIAIRELRSFFSTPVAYGVLTVYAVLGGFFFFLGLQEFLRAIQIYEAQQMLSFLDELNLNDWVIAPSFGSFAIIFLLLVPVLTMRTFAEERSNGTVELLLTSPVTSGELVLGKYLAVLAVVGLIVGITALYPGLLFVFGDPELWQTLAGLLALFLYGAALAALGCFVSSLTRSQILAALVAFVVGLILFLLDVAGRSIEVGWLAESARYLGTQAHFQNGLEGRVHSDDLAYFGILIAFFLFMARNSVESLRWR